MLNSEQPKKCVKMNFQAKWSGDGAAGQQDQLTGEAERILKQAQSKSLRYIESPG